MGRLRVLCVLPGADPGAGAEESFAATAPGLMERGIELHLAVLGSRQGLVPAFELAGGIVHDLSGARGLAARVAQLRDVVRAVGPDMLHATLWDAALPSHLVAATCRVPLVVTWAGVTGVARGASAGAPWKLQLLRAADVALGRLSGCTYHAVTDGIAKVNASALHVDPDRVAVVERGRPDLSPPHTTEVGRTRADLGLDGADGVVLAVGRLVHQKDYPTLVRAASRLLVDHPVVQVLIAGGDGPAAAGLEQEISRRGLESTVRLLGHRDDVPVLLQLADVVVLSSRFEGAAGGVIEAMRSARPIVATDVEGQRGILVDGVNALVVPVGDDTAMSNALGRVLDDHQLARSLGAAARATFEQRFTLDRAVEGLEALYRDVAGAAA